MTPVCGFCQGKPVRNAATWSDPTAPLYAPCPRCGADPAEHYCAGCGVELGEDESGRCARCEEET
jgi:hypothetical protein